MLRFVALLSLLLPLGAAQDAAERLLKEAIALQQTGDVEGAIPQYRAYLKLRPEAVEARSNLAVALARVGRYREAIAEYREALRLRPRDPRIRLNLALAQYKAGQIAEAAAELTALHKEQPSERQVLLLLADCRLRLGEDVQVIELLTPLEAGAQNDLAIAYLLGTALLRAGQLERGQRVIDGILRNGDSAASRLLLGTSKFGAEEFETAIVDLKKAAELDPKLPEVHSYLGRAYIQTGDVAAAQAEFRKELDLNPTDFESNLQLGALLKQEQDYAGARRLLARALELRPGDVGRATRLPRLTWPPGSRTRPARRWNRCCGKLRTSSRHTSRWLQCTTGWGGRRRETANGRWRGS